MSRDPHTNDRIDYLMAVAGLSNEALGVTPLSIETDLMREGVFLSLPYENEDGETEA
jgi:hypothetical protein